MQGYSPLAFFMKNKWAFLSALKSPNAARAPELFPPSPTRAETKALIGGGGCIFIYSRSARRISFEINGNDN